MDDQGVGYESPSGLATERDAVACGRQPSPEVTMGIGRVALGDMLRRSARRFPDKIAVVTATSQITFASLDEMANRCANFLIGQGLQPGDRVATACTNSIDFIIVIYGIHKAGLVWVPINPQLGDDDKTYILEHAEVSLMFVDVTGGHGPSGGVVTAYPLGEAFRSLLSQQPVSEPDVAMHERDLVMIMYTSGTTSRPKGVMHCSLSVYAGVMGNMAEWQVTRGDKLLIILPMFHVAAHALFTTFMSAGATVVLHDGFQPARVLDAIDKHKITFFVGLPMMYAALLDDPAITSTDVSSLRMCIYSMAPMPHTLLRRLISDFCPVFALTSGQTEMYPITVMFRPEQQLLKEGNYWGEPSIVNDLAIMDDDGTLLPSGQIGEIVHRGPNVMLGYYKDEEATANARRFGWHHTGDLGMIDEDGQLLFVDRLKDMIKTGGENVASVKIEEVLLRHPSIANVAAIGVPHPRWQEAVVGVVMLKPGEDASEADLLMHCREVLAPHEVPKSIQFVEDLPLTATSKLRKVELRSRFLELFGV